MATRNFSEVLRWQAYRRPAHEALVDGPDRWTYAELDAEVDRYAAALREVDVGPDVLVGVLGRNRAGYILILLALSRLGAVAVPLNWRLHAEEQSYIIEHAGIGVLVYDDDFHDDATVLRAVSGVRAGVATGRRPWESDPRLDDLLAQVSPGTRVADAPRTEDDLHRLLYTSGTTARPKGVMLTCGNVAANHLGQLLELELTAADRILVSAPMFHVSGLEAPGLGIFVAGGTMVVARSFKPDDIADQVRDERITGLVLAAQILFGLLERRLAADFGSVRYLIFAGVDPGVRRRVKAAAGHLRLIDTYAMTETCNGVCYMDAEHEQDKIGALGVPFPMVHLRIVDEDLRDVPTGESGEIVVRGPKVSPGYWRDPTATEGSRRDGWFLTGDIGRLDADGYLWFVDRRTDLIKSGGENIATAEVERVLLGHEAIAEAAVIGVPDERWDEVPKAFVLPVPDHPLAAEDVVRYCAERLARFKVPRQVEIVRSLPRNDSGKVLKKVLREREGAR